MITILIKYLVNDRINIQSVNHPIIQSYSHKILLIFIFLFFFSHQVFPETRYVSKTGSSTPPFTTWETASDSIQKCINISNYDDTIYVGNGVYKEKVVMIPGLSLIGSGMDSCVIDTRSLATPQDHFAIQMKEYCNIEGFLILVSNNRTGLGIYFYVISSDSIHIQGAIKNNKISGSGYGIAIDFATVRTENNIIENSLVGIQVGAAFNPVYDTIYNNYMVDIYNYGILTEIDARIIAYNNIIICNDNYGQGFAFGNTGGSEAYNNLVLLARKGISSNPYPKRIINNVILNYLESGIYLQGNDTTINNIIMNGDKGLYHYNPGYTAKHNNSWNNNYNYYGFTPDSTNLSVDPMFVNEDNMDYHLQMFSPLIDAGDPDILDVDSTRSDIGLYGGPFGEKTEYQDLAPKAPKGITISTDSVDVFLSWKKNTESDFRSYYLYSDSIPGFSADTTSFLTELTDTFFIHNLPHGYNRIYYKLRAKDNQTNLSKVSDEVGVVLVSNNEKPEIVQEFKLYQNYPNPFNPTTRIPFRLKERGYVKLYVYDIKGELVSVLVNEEREAGYYEVEFNPGEREYMDIASGIYIYQIDVKTKGKIPVFRDIKKMIFLK